MSDSPARASSRGAEGARVDVVVAGAGGAGLAAAVAAAEQGASVVVLEALDSLSGTTSYSVGSMAAAGTRLQRRAGIEDDACAFAEDICLTHPRAAEPRHLRLTLAQEAGPTLAWLEGLGMVFVGPYPEPPNRVPRMHNAVPNGRSYLDVLSHHARRLGVDIRVGCRVTGLIRSGRRVTGVRYCDGYWDQDLLARRGIVLATGDFAGNTELRAAHLDRTQANSVPVNKRSSGDGHLILQGEGIELRNMDMAFGPQLRLTAPTERAIERLPSWTWLRRLMGFAVTRMPLALTGPLIRQLLVAHMGPADILFEQGAVLVDSTGRACGLEDSRIVDLANAPKRRGYVLGDRRLARQFSAYPWFVSTAPGIAYAYFQHYARARPDLIHWNEDISGLAHEMGMGASVLTASASGLAPPYFVLGPIFPMLTVTEGGAPVDARMNVCASNGSPVPGLYAAGGTGQGGLTLKGHGLHLAWALTSGRLAGLSAARTSEAMSDGDTIGQHGCYSSTQRSEVASGA